MILKIEQTILKHLIYDEVYTRKVLPFLKDEYFIDRNERLLFDQINQFISKYNTNPTYEALVIQLNDCNLSQEDFTETSNILSTIQETKNDLCKLEWLIDKSESWCKDQAIYIGIKESVKILDGRNKTLDKGAIPKLLSDALSVDFNINVGHDYINDWESRYDYYNTKENKIPFSLDIFNKVTNGGVERKTLNMFLGPPHSAKTLVMCSLAASYLNSGYNVLYITLEMSDYKISERIDCNLLNIKMDDIRHTPKSTFETKINKLKTKNIGKLIVKEFPTKSVNTNHIRRVLNDLDLKQNFVPDIIFVDYLNLLLSYALKASAASESYKYILSVAEELRGLAQERNLVIWSATQTNRGGSQSTDLTFSDTSDSFGIPAITDAYWGLIFTDELKELNQCLIKQLKNRYKDLNYMEKFVVGVSRPYMRLYDLEKYAQTGLVSTANSDFSYSDTFESTTKRVFDSFKF